MTSTQIKKLNAYPEWNTPNTYEQVLNYIQSINEDEEPQYPPNLNSSKKIRYKQKFSQDFIVEPLNNELTIFYRPHIQGQENQRIKIPVARPNQHQEILKRIYNDDKLGLGVGLDQFYYQVCSQYVGIKRVETREFLRQQGNYQISRPIKKAINQPILSKTPNEIWGMDITYLNYLQIKTKKNDEGEREPREINEETGGVENVENKLTKNLNQFNDDGTKGYILTVVDFFSKKVWARALSQNNAEQVLSLIDEYGSYGYKVIKKTGMWDFRFKNKSCQVDNCYCRRQATIYNDLLISLPNESDIEVTFPTIKEMNDNTVQQFDEIDSSEFDYLLQLLKNITFKSVVNNHRKGFPSHRCAVFGYTNYRVIRKGLYSGLSSDSIKYPEIYNELLRLGQNIVCPNREFNAIHINHNLTCPPHKDDKNVGKSILVSIGNYTGSNLIVNGISYKTYCRPIRFNGCNLLHYNTPDLVGDKYSIVYYVANLRKNKTENEFYESYDAINEDDFEEVHIDDDNSCLFDED